MNYDIDTQKEELNNLYPGLLIEIGYIGNLDLNYDDRHWYVWVRNKALKVLNSDGNAKPAGYLFDTSGSTYKYPRSMSYPIDGPDKAKPGNADLAVWLNVHADKLARIKQRIAVLSKLL